jgi:hypothetical protein
MGSLFQPSAPTSEHGTVGAWRGFGRGLVPLALLATGIAMTLALTLAARALTTGLGFALSQWIAPGILIVGLVATGAAYGVALARTFRRWRAQLRDERSADGAGMLWALVVTSVMVAAPLVVAALVPQHPAP